MTSLVLAVSLYNSLVDASGTYCGVFLFSNASVAEPRCTFMHLTVDGGDLDRLLAESLLLH